MSLPETAAASAAHAARGLHIRPLGAMDLDAVVAIDEVAAGRPRRAFYERRLALMARDPDGFVALAAEREGKIGGFVIARLYEGEFGGMAPEAALDALGVAAELRHHGVGHALIDGLVAAMRIHGVEEIATEAEWISADLMGFFADSNFALAPRLVLECLVSEASGRRADRRRSTRATRAPKTAEIDYSGASGDDFEALSHDRIPIRSMTPADLASLIQIDRRITGRDRRAYYTRKLDEAMHESAVRVSLVAEIEAKVAGFVMARVDFGEYGSFEPGAVMDTIGVESASGHKGVATALLSQLITNLAGLRVETVRTEVAWNQFGLLSFLDRMGFRPHRRLAFRRALG